MPCVFVKHVSEWKRTAGRELGRINACMPSFQGTLSCECVLPPLEQIGFSPYIFGLSGWRPDISRPCFRTMCVSGVRRLQLRSSDLFCGYRMPPILNNARLLVLVFPTKHPPVNSRHRHHKPLSRGIMAFREANT